MVLNPFREAVTFPYAKTLGEPVYRIGGEAVLSDGVLTVPAVFAGIYRI